MKSEQTECNAGQFGNVNAIIDAFETEYNYLYKLRIGGEDVSSRMKLLISKINSIDYYYYEKNNHYQERADLLVAKIYHQLGVISQNNNQYKMAINYLTQAIELRNAYDNPEAGYSIFQKFMAASSAYDSYKSEIFTDILHSDIQDDWIMKMCNDIQKNAQMLIWMDDSQMKWKGGILLNNIGYIYQKCFAYCQQEIAETLHLSGDNKYSYLNSALDYYIQGLNVRLDYMHKIKHDISVLRVIAQTFIRMGQCYISLLREILINNYKMNNTKTENLLNISPDTLILRVYLIIDIVDYVYFLYPQEKFRQDDLQELKINCSYVHARYNSVINHKFFENKLNDSKNNNLDDMMFKLMNILCQNGEN